MKACRVCTHTLPLDKFPLVDSMPDGRHVICSACIAKEPWKNRAKCRRCGSNRLLLKFPGMDPERVCLVCSPVTAPAGHAAGVGLDATLAGAGLTHGGPVRTVTEILADLGVVDPPKSVTNAAAAWLRASGFTEARTPGRKGFRVVTGAQSGNRVFRQWAETYRCADALGLSTHDRDRYLAGAEPPLVVRLAMSALIAGLPAYSACVTGNTALE